VILSTAIEGIAACPIVVIRVGFAPSPRPDLTQSRSFFKKLFLFFLLATHDSLD
jgi:hypothetical protein